MNIDKDRRPSADELDKELTRRIEEFQYQQSTWELRRNAEQEYLEQTAQQLSDAWLALEDQQRLLLRSNAASVLVSPETLARQNLSADVRPEPVAMDPSPSPMAEPTPAMTVNTRVSIPRDLVPRNVAIRQFEKLRNEIQSARRSH